MHHFREADDARLALPGSAQDRGNREGEWRYIWGDAWSTRYSPLDQINADNFGDLEVAWFWKGDNFGPSPDNVGRSTPIYADGIVYTVAGRRRTVVAIDPATGETLWTFREPNTARWEDSPRQIHGRGVAYYEIDGQGVIYVVTPGFFLHALDAKTGYPLADFGSAIPIDGFPLTGTVDMLATLGHSYRPTPPYATPVRSAMSCFQVVRSFRLKPLRRRWPHARASTFMRSTEAVK